MNICNEQQIGYVPIRVMIEVDLYKVDMSSHAFRLKTRKKTTYVTA